MELQRSQLYACYIQFALEAKIISKIKKNEDPNLKSLWLKKVCPKPKKFQCKSGSDLNGARSVSPPVAFTFGDHDHFKGWRTRCKHFKIIACKMQITCHK